jgi:hypothetical protein
LYIIPDTLQKRKANNTNSCNQFKYKVPWIDEIGNRNGSFDLCCETFKDLFKVGCTRLQGLQRRKTDPNNSFSLQKKASGWNGFPQTVWDNLKVVLETEPRESSHYASNNPPTTTVVGCVYLDFGKNICNFTVQMRINFSWLKQKTWDPILPITGINIIQ